MFFFRRLMRLLLLILALIVGIVLFIGCTKLLRMHYNDTRFRQLQGWWLTQVAWLIGARVKTIGQPVTENVMYVANHVSWLDIPVLGGLLAPRFLSKAEVKNWPVVGWLASGSGTLYIERGQSAQAASEAISQALSSQQCVLLFPEGTTTDGISTKRFFARLFAPAIAAGAKVQPIALRYLTPEGEKHTIVPYIGEQSMGQNLWAVMAEPAFTVEVHFLAPLEATGMERKALSTASEQAIQRVL